MPKLIMTRGLPASGKSTWAKEMTKKGYKRINKDDLRDMVDAGKWSKNNEKTILGIRDELVAYLLGGGYNVIVDDTNLAPKHETNLREIAEQCGAEFEIKSFLDVPIKECIRRDLLRHPSVGERVIKGMFNQFLRPKFAEYTPNQDLPNAIICDIDGTLAHMTGRSPYDYTQVHTDTVDVVVRDILHKYDSDNNSAQIIIVSGREDSCKEVTEKWLKDNNVPYDEIYMRKAGDLREDSIVKSEIFDMYIRDRFNVLYVLDDRNRVVEMWRELGLKVLQVAEGDF